MKPRILIIEDELTVATYFRCSLWSDFEVEIAETIADAMMRLTDDTIPICCVTLDLHLPDGIGLPLIKKIRENFPQVPIVVITGFDYTQLEVTAAGACDFLRKPDTPPRVLIETIKRAITQGKAEGQSA